MKKSIVHPPQQQQEEEGHEWTYQGQFLREMFDMDAVMALEQGMFVCLESSVSVCLSLSNITNFFVV
jgi:hypothetical protein